jgi:hypothetical protein
LQDTFYFAKDLKGTYYAYSTVDFDYTFLFDSIPSKFISYPFLKDNVPVASTWETPLYGTVKLVTGTTTEYGDTKAVFTIIDKNTVSHAAGGTTYSNVINVKREIMFKPTGSNTFRLILTGNSYYAKNFGLIDQVIGTQSVPLFNAPVIK